MSGFSSEAVPVEQLAVQAAASVNGAELVLAVRIRNVSQQPLYIFNRPQDYQNYGASPKVGHLLSQILSRDEGLIVFGMVVPWVPPGMSVEVLSVPCATLLAPGEELKDRADIPLPINEYTPYLPITADMPVKLASTVRGEVWVEYVAANEKLVVSPNATAGCVNVSGFSRNMIKRAVASIESLRVQVRQRVNAPL